LRPRVPQNLADIRTDPPATLATHRSGDARRSGSFAITQPRRDAVSNVANLLKGYRSRAATFENPTGAPASGGTVADGRKGAPWARIRPGEKVTLASFDGSGSLTHFWMTISQAGTPPPGFLRAQVLEITYGTMDEPSVSVPIGDYFGAVHGLAAPYASALTAVNEGRGYSSRVPVPFRDGIMITYENHGERSAILYYQIDALLGPQDAAAGYLHATFRRENPTTIRDDFAVWDCDLHGPGRFLGWTGGVRVHDGRWWWGEGEMKFYFDGEALPTICGTGTEDYLDSGWGLGTFHAPETGAPMVTSVAGPTDDVKHELVTFYRWHMSDPVVFDRTLRATIQQIGAAGFPASQRSEYEAFKASVQSAGNGWSEELTGLAGMGLYERSDDWCGTAFVYLETPQAVPRVDVENATRDLAPPTGEFVRRTMPVPSSVPG
jgi:D-arabinan exo alpha-(1,3)/(1,5)-arabinofuranosidase (non-reducing end)